MIVIIVKDITLILFNWKVFLPQLVFRYFWLDSFINQNRLFTISMMPPRYAPSHNSTTFLIHQVLTDGTSEGFINVSIVEINSRCNRYSITAAAIISYWLLKHDFLVVDDMQFITILLCVIICVIFLLLSFHRYLQSLFDNLFE